MRAKRKVSLVVPAHIQVKAHRGMERNGPECGAKIAERVVE